MSDIKKTKYQTFTVELIHRSKINFAYYNPRKISKENRNNLKQSLKTDGYLDLPVWNEQTGNIVGGHQRVSLIDELEGSPDYYIEVKKINVPIEIEVKLNIKLNNPNLMGEYDNDKFQELLNEFDFIDPIKDLEFDRLDLDYMNIEIDKEEKTEKVISNEDVSKLKEINKKYRKEKKLAEKENGDTIYGERNDYILTIVFNTNIDKQNFNAKIGVDRFEKNIKYSKLYDKLKDEFKV